MTIENAGALKKTIMSALEGGKELRVDITQITSIDLSGMQILIALAKECRERSITLMFDGKPNPVVRGRLEDAGFIDKKGECDGPLDLVFRT